MHLEALETRGFDGVLERDWDGHEVWMVAQVSDGCLGEVLCLWTTQGACSVEEMTCRHETYRCILPY